MITPQGQALKRILEAYWESRHCFPNHIVSWSLYHGSYGKPWKPGMHDPIFYRQGRQIPAHVTKRPYKRLIPTRKPKKLINYIPAREREGQTSYLH